MFISFLPDLLCCDGLLYYYLYSLFFQSFKEATLFLLIVKYLFSWRNPIFYSFSKICIISVSVFSFFTLSRIFYFCDVCFILKQ